MESFYGGRQGASFVIKKRFDCISRNIEIGDTKQSPDYVKYIFKYFKYSEEKEAFIVVKNNDKYSLIERQLDNYSLQPLDMWKAVLCDGKSFIDAKFIAIDENDNTTEISISEIDNIPAEILTEGMLELFEEGISSLNEVNYGEYVLISNKHHDYPYNGQVYRRGFDNNDGWYGAEYIGNIIGPQGNPLDLTFVDYDANRESKHFIPTFISGTEIEKHNNEIKLQYQTYKDELNSTNKYDIGLQIPYHVFNFEAENIPYYQGENEQVPTVELNRIEGDKVNNFYYDYQLKVPYAVPGDKIQELKQFKGYVKAGTAYYKDSECTEKVGTLDKITQIVKEIDYSLDEKYHKIKLNENTRDSSEYYVLKQNENEEDNLIYDVLYQGVIKYSNTDKDDSGKLIYSFVADYNTINKIELKDDGTIAIHYSGIKNIEEQSNKIKWIKNSAVVDEKRHSELIGKVSPLPPIGSLVVRYNTPKEDNIQYYNWSLDDGTITNDWVILGYAQNLTGIKIYKHIDNFNPDTNGAYNKDVPDGWAISAVKDEQIICYIKHTINEDAVEWVEVPLKGNGGSASTITPTINAGVDTLEKEMLLGRDTIITQKTLNNGNVEVITEYRNDDITDEYYSLTTIVYAEGQEPNVNIEVQDEILMFLKDKDAAVEEGVLVIKNPNLLDNNFEMNVEKLIKEDTLSYISNKGNTIVPYYKKITTMQILTDGTQIIKERNTQLF